MVLIERLHEIMVILSIICRNFSLQKIVYSLEIIIYRILVLLLQFDSFFKSLCHLFSIPLKLFSDCRIDCSS